MTLKMRDSMHDRDIREFTIDGNGMHISRAFSTVNGILSDHPVFSAPEEVDRVKDLFKEAYGMDYQGLQTSRDGTRFFRENTDFVSAIFDSLIGHAVVAADFDGTILAYTEGAHQIYGYAAEEVIGKKNIEEFFPEEFVAKGGLQHTVSALIEKEWYAVEGEKIRKDGSTFPAHMIFTLAKDRNDRVLGVVEIVQDLTARKQSENLLRASEERLRLIIESCPDSMLIVDADGIIRFLNTAAESLFQRSGGDLLTSYFGFPLVDGERTEIEIVRPPGHGTAVVEMRVTEIEWEGKESRLAILRDITERKQMEERLTRLSLRDQLTGLYNRFFFEEEMQRIGGGRFDPVGIIMCDVDGLKIVNDATGHSSGDILLLTVAKILKDTFRESDIVARVGGDEFAVLLPNTPLDTLKTLCSRLEERIERYNEDSTAIPLSLSTGCAVKDGPSRDMPAVYKEADDSMYRRKYGKYGAPRSSILRYFAQSMEAKNIIAPGRAERIGRILTSVARDLGMAKDDIKNLRLLARYCDIGKIGMPEDVALKPGPLTPEETAEMQEHPKIGCHIAQQTPELTGIAERILHHHEWWNGGGYPLGLRGEAIPLECRLIAIASAYDSMTHDRPHRKALTHEEATAEIRRSAGTQYDPGLVEKFLAILGEKRTHQR